LALHDWWLVGEAYRLDALAVAEMPDLDWQELLLTKLALKVGGYRLLKERRLVASGFTLPATG
jgi:pyrroloquinoline-quinone synthase